MGPAWSSPHRQGVNRSVHGAPRVRVNHLPNRRRVDADDRQRTSPSGLSGDFFQRQVSALQAQKLSARIFRGPPGYLAAQNVKAHAIVRARTPPLGRNPSPNRVPPISRAPRRLIVGEGPLAAASPQTPWLGGTDSVLRLVTCWSYDALRLSSSGRTGRFHPPPTSGPRETVLGARTSSGKPNERSLVHPCERRQLAVEKSLDSTNSC
jgi:hypothetical protein